MAGWGGHVQPDVQDDWMPAAGCIASFPPCWYNGLEQLDLKNVSDLPRLFAEAGNIAWPNLKKMHLQGGVDNQVKNEDEMRSSAKQSCTNLVQGLITMLPSTPNITTILIEMRCISWSEHTSPFQLRMCLGNPAQCAEAGCESRSYRFVPNYDNGVAVAVGTDFSGHVATELQHTVRRHQLRDLGVFYHYDKSSTWSTGWQWDLKEGCWDATFKQEADEFMDQMGRYIDWTQSM